MAESKKCSGCNEIKLLNEFHKHKGNKDGHTYICKECAKKRTRHWVKNNSEHKKQSDKIYRENHKEQGSQYQIDYRKKNAEKLKKDKVQYSKDNADRAYLRGKKYRNNTHFDGNRYKTLERDNYTCTKCGSKNNLVVHHKDYSGKETHNRNSTINHLITLCRPCHSRLHAILNGLGVKYV